MGRFSQFSLALLLAGSATAGVAQVAHPDRWPAAKSVGLVDAATEAKVTALMQQMTLEEKIGQMIQADIGSIKPEDLRRYPLGSILAGGSSPPLGSPDRSPAAAWVATSRAFNAVALEKRAGHVAIPLMFGVDAVHGDNNVVGATLFPRSCVASARSPPRRPPRPGSTGRSVRPWRCRRTIAGAAPMRAIRRTRRWSPPMPAR
jgi:beta-glucosidase